MATCPECHVRQSVANDNDDDEIEPGAIHWYPDIYLTVEESRGKPQLGDLKKAVRPDIASS